MKKMKWLPVLMGITILAIAGFQVYWINRSGAVPDSLGELIQQFKDNFTVSGADGSPADPTKTDAEELGEAQSAKTLATE